MSSLRIVSLVPSLTHMVCDFGLKPSVMGCTTFCVDPPDLRRTAVDIGGTKNPDLEKIASLMPTHILVNEEENKPEHILACEDLAPTLRTFPKTPSDVPGLLRTVGAWLGKADAGERWAIEVEEGLRRVAGLVRCAPLDKRTYLYLIWKEPYMVVSDDTYIAAMLRLIGLENVGGDAARYPTLSIADMKARSPDYLMFSSEPYPFRQRDMATLKTQWAEARLASGRLSDCAPRCLKVDGKLLSWYGTMTVEGLAYLTKIHGELAGLTDEVNQPF